MAFRFRLEKVLEVRIKQQEVAQTAHAQAQAELAAAEQRLAELESERAAGRREFDRLKQEDRVSGEAIYLHSLHQSGLRHALGAATEKVASAEAEVERAGEVLVEAHRARKAMEKLKAKELAEWERNQARRERKSQDEVASRKSAREENHGP